MTDLDRKVCNLYLSGLTTEQIADALGWTEDDVLQSLRFLDEVIKSMPRPRGDDYNGV